MDYYGLRDGLQGAMGELALWANISKEHPTFLLMVAGLSGLKIEANVEEVLAFFHDNFQRVEEGARKFAQMPFHNGGAGEFREDVHFLIKEFTTLNSDFMTHLQEIKEIIHPGKEKNTVWRLLIVHILDEQLYIGRQLDSRINQFYY